LRAIRQLAGKGRVGHTYNIAGAAQRPQPGGGRAICATGAASAEARRLIESQIEFVRDRPGHDRSYAIEAGKIRVSWVGWRRRRSKAKKKDFEDSALVPGNAEWVVGRPRRDVMSAMVELNYGVEMSAARRGIVAGGGSGKRLYPVRR